MPLFEQRQINHGTAQRFLASYIGNQRLFYEKNEYYVKDYRSLYLCLENDSIPELQSFANAFLVDIVDDSSPVCVQRQTKPTAFYGYFFLEDYFGKPFNRPGDDSLAFMAFPAVYGKTGNYVFWIDDFGVTKRNRPKVKSGTTALELIGYYIGRTPLNPNTDLEWEDVADHLRKPIKPVFDEPVSGAPSSD